MITWLRSTIRKWREHREEERDNEMLINKAGYWSGDI